MKRVLISIVTFIIILSMVSNVYATSGSISVNSSSNTVVKGKTFTVTLAGTADAPIDGMYTKFTYDKNVLSLEGTVQNENYGNNSSEGEILISSNADTSPTSTTLYTMTFKVLDTASVDSTTISFSESELHLKDGDTTKDFATNIDDVVINIKADDTTVGNQGGGTETPDENTGNNPSNDNGNGNSNPDNGSNDGASDSGSEKENTNKNVDKNKNTNKNTAKNTTTKLPQTGAESASIIAIIALGAISIVSYISYRKYKNI